MSFALLPPPFVRQRLQGTQHPGQLSLDGQRMASEDPARIL